MLPFIYGADPFDHCVQVVTLNALSALALRRDQRKLNLRPKIKLATEQIIEIVSTHKLCDAQRNTDAQPSVQCILISPLLNFGNTSSITSIHCSISNRFGSPDTAYYCKVSIVYILQHTKSIFINNFWFAFC